jgi:predicted tellurium resistance membrane protein TerC
MLSKLMDRYPIILWIGAAILGRVGGEMLITDPLVQSMLLPPTWVAYATEAFFVLVVCGLAKLLLMRRETAGRVAVAAAD